jgi:alpha-L-fucosidase
MEIENLWKAEHWDPGTLAHKYKAAGAKYIVALANHHDNLDTFDSKHHSWNTLNVGPKRDIIGTWEKAVRGEGLRFGVSNHSAHAWHWWQTAYGYDTEGPLHGVRYDAFRLTKADGKGKWWEGLDPQELYTGPAMVPPDGITSIAAMNTWHDAHDGQWLETSLPYNPLFARKWLMRQMDLVEKYRPDLVYLDDTRLPFGDLGLQAAAHYYNQSLAWHGKIDVVMTAKKLETNERHGLVEDIERGFTDHLWDEPWQTCTCIGNWHYDRRIYEQKAYKPAKEVIQRLCDVVSKNGNLLLSIPMRGDGTIDEEEEKILDAMTAWMAINEEAIFASRPWRGYVEGPTKPPTGMMNEQNAAPFTARDIRFTTRDSMLYAAFLDWPEGKASITSLGTRALPAADIRRVSLLGHGPLRFTRDEAGLMFRMPPSPKGGFVPVVRLEGERLV